MYISAEKLNKGENAMLCKESKDCLFLFLPQYHSSQRAFTLQVSQPLYQLKFHFISLMDTGCKRTPFTKCDLIKFTQAPNLNLSY